MATSPVFIAVQQVATAAESTGEFSTSMAHHAMAAAARSPLDLMLVVLGGVVVILTTSYSLLYLIRPGEASADHIKYRILEDGRAEHQ
jgi:hypothetical protein